MENLFTAPTTTEAGVRRLDCTAALTSYSDNEARTLLQKVNADPELQMSLKASFTDSDAQDSLISIVLGHLSTDAIIDADEEQLKRLLASQQSKRSRSKGKEMTVANYLSMMSAAIAESIIRTAIGRPRGAAAKTSTVSLLTEDETQMFANDLDAANKKIRVLQSWKSTHKHLVDTAEWSVVCQNISTLQGLRPASTSIKVAKEDPRVVEIRQRLAGKDLDKLKAGEKAALLEEILAQLG